MKRKLLAALGLSLAVVLVHPSPATAITTTAEQDAEVYLLGLINTRRAGAGDTVLIEHPFIRAKARGHSQNMINQARLGHFGFAKRVRAIRRADGGIRGYICENVAYAKGYPSGAPTMQGNMDRIFQNWINSTGHRECMDDVNGTTHSAGVGVQVKGGRWWATFITANDSTP